MDLSSQVGLRLEVADVLHVVLRRRNGPEQSGGIATVDEHPQLFLESFRAGGMDLSSQVGLRLCFQGTHQS